MYFDKWFIGIIVFYEWKCPALNHMEPDFIYGPVYRYKSRVIQLFVCKRVKIDRT